MTEYDELARRSALAIEQERRRAGLRAVERTRATDAGRYVRPSRDEDDHGPEMLAAVAGICAVVLIVLSAWALWATGVLS